MGKKDKASTKAKAKAAEVEDDELDELEEDEATDTPAKKSKGGDEVAFGAADLAALLTEKTGKTVTPRDLRTLLRRMARDGRIEREIVPGNKARYSWSGPDDPEVKAVIKAVTKGEIEDGKKEALAKLKEQKAAKMAAKAKEEAKASKKGKKAKPAPVEVDEDDEDLDDED